MSADCPVQGRGYGLEVCKECDTAFEVRELTGRDWEEAGVIIGTVMGLSAIFLVHQR